MLKKIRTRQEYLGLSLRNLASQFEVSPALLSLVLNGKRKPSKAMTRKLASWLRRPVATDLDHCPSSLIDKFIEDRSSHLASSTLEFYRGKLHPFAVWCEKHQISDVREIQRANISAFLAFIKKGRSGAPRTLNSGGIKLFHQCLKTFFLYVGEECDTTSEWKNPVDGIKVKGSQAQTLEYSDTEVEQMFRTIDKGTNALLRLRNRAMLMVLLNSAVRASELLSMNVNDVGDKGRVMVTGKGSKQRVVTIGESGLEAVDCYLVERGNRGGALWQTFEGQRLTRDGLRSLFVRIESKHPEVFTDGLYAHRFRHTAITRLLRARVPLRSVQRYAGHSDPQTTLRYAQAIDADEAITAINDELY
ncbi:tyrosine-type recombinase/integrase [Candidatus Lucifugimonas marina]|nr:tyrosine-type recombinase/integrase [SAR202 cluster bacterium JH545]